MDEPEAKKINFTLVNNDELEYNFRCQICKLYLFGYIMTCSNGHSTCELCYNMLNDISCGQCRDRNIKNDKLTSRYMSCYSIEKECPYQCQIKFNSLNCQQHIESNHLKRCINRQFKCLFCDDFYFKISKDNLDLKNHLINIHNVSIITTPLYFELDLNIYNTSYSKIYFYEQLGKQYLILVNDTKSNLDFSCFEITLNQKSSSRFHLQFENRNKKQLSIENNINTFGEININLFNKILKTQKYKNVLSSSLLHNFLNDTYLENALLNDNYLIKICLSIIP
jgi:hypothetical protein